jgi:diguanylate cyclase (GGDEF)-like protein
MRSFWTGLYAVIGPGGLVLLAAVGFLRPGGLPGWIQPLVSGLPLLVLAFGLVFGMLLNCSRIILAMVLLTVVDRTLVLSPSGGEAASEIGRMLFQATAFLLPLNVLGLSLLGECGLISTQARIGLAALLIQTLIVAGLCRLDPTAVAYALESGYLDASWFAWTPLGQPALLSFVSAFTLQLARWGTARSALEAGTVWALFATFLAFHGTRYGWLPTNYFTTAGLILIVTFLTTSYRSSYVDQRSGLAGREALDLALTRAGKPYAVALVGIDQAKELTDRYGRGIGDQAFRLIAAKLARVGGGGKAFYYAGEECAILFPGKSTSETMLALEEFRKAVEASTFLLLRRRSIVETTRQSRRTGADEQIAMTVSIGVASTGEEKVAPAAVIRSAYQALHQASQEGGNQVKRGSTVEIPVTKSAPVRARASAVGWVKTEGLG